MCRSGVVVAARVGVLVPSAIVADPDDHLSFFRLPVDRDRAASAIFRMLDGIDERLVGRHDNRSAAQAVDPRLQQPAMKLVRSFFASEASLLRLRRKVRAVSEPTRGLATTRPGDVIVHAHCNRSQAA
jgi:hypothetical protein